MKRRRKGQNKAHVLWRSVPSKLKRWAALAAIGWAVEGLFGVSGFVLLLIFLFLAGMAWALLNQAVGRKVTSLAVDEIAGQIADLVAMPLFIPVARAWVTAVRENATAEIATAIAYTFVFVTVKLAMPWIVREMLTARGRRVRRRS